MRLDSINILRPDVLFEGVLKEVGRSVAIALVCDDRVVLLGLVARKLGRVRFVPVVALRQQAVEQPDLAIARSIVRYLKVPKRGARKPRVPRNARRSTNTPLANTSA